MIPRVGRQEREDERKQAQLDPGVILVVDESLAIRKKLHEILEKLGTPGGRIVEATTEAEALAAFRDHRPRVVFTELVGVHPEDGLEVIHAMLDIDPDTRIVLVSAEPRDSREVRAALRAGVFSFIEKPLRYEKIRALLAELQAEEGGIERYR